MTPEITHAGSECCLYSEMVVLENLIPAKNITMIPIIVFLYLTKYFYFFLAKNQQLRNSSLPIDKPPSIPTPSVTRSFISQGKHKFTEMCSNRNTSPLPRVNAIHLTPNQGHLFRCPPQPSRKYFNVYSGPLNMRDEDLQRFTPIRSPPTRQLLTPSNTEHSQLNVSRYQNMNWSQPLQLGQSPGLLSTPTDRSINYRPPNDAPLMDCTYIKPPRTHNSQMYEAFPQHVSNMHSYNNVMNTQVPPVNPLMTPTGHIVDFYRQHTPVQSRPIMNQLSNYQENHNPGSTPFNYIPQQSHYQARQSSGIYGNEYMRNSAYMHPPPTMEFGYQRSTNTYNPDGMFWDEGTVPHENFPTDIVNFHHNHPSSGIQFNNSSLPFPTRATSFSQQHQSPVSATYIPPRTNVTEDEILQEDFSQYDYNHPSHYQNSPEPILSLAEHISDDENTFQHR